MDGSGISPKIQGQGSPVSVEQVALWIGEMHINLKIAQEQIKTLMREKQEYKELLEKQRTAPEVHVK